MPPKAKGAGPNPKTLLGRVTSALANHKAVFTIGGAIDITPSETATDNQSLVVRWDSGEESHARKIGLPVGDSDVSKGAFSQLLKDCDPATYGRGEEEVFDETYRKAQKLEASQFSTSFCPYEHGVMDTVIQALVHSKYCGIRAELYNLNIRSTFPALIYSGPSGKFKPHVDTPRSKEQMGSLVVCLPHQHEGGQLAVRHGGKEVVFDWASEMAKNPSSIQWAAFFSDCEHEVLEVTDGHRITMTYNLYWTSQGPASMADHLGALEPELLVFFSALKALIECPSFLPEGGILGFSCTHAYPHTSESLAKNLHKGLKGLDMLVYQALKSLAGCVTMEAALDDSKYQSHMEEYGQEEDSEEFSEDEKALRPNTKGTAIGPLPATPILTDDLEEYGPPVNPTTLSRREMVRGKWTSKPAYERREVTWLNHPPNSPDELAVAYLTYGNQPGINAYYSSAVIIAKLGRFDKKSGSRVPRKR